MKRKDFFSAGVMAVMAFFLLGTARGGFLDAHIDDVQEGMQMGQVLSLLGTPSGSTQGPGDKVVLLYSDSYPPKTWAITFERNRVDSVKEVPPKEQHD